MILSGEILTVERVGVLAEVLLGQPVYLLYGTFGGDFHDSAPDRGYAPGVRRVHHVDGHAWIAANVLVLLATPDDVDRDVLSVRLDPHLGDLGRAVWHERGDLAKSGLPQQLPESGRNGLRQDPSSG